MKKKLLALMMATTMAALTLAGCDSTDDVDTIVDSLENLDYYYSVQAEGLDDAVLLITSDDGEGGTYVEETGAYGWFGTPDMTIGGMMEEWGIVSIEPKSEEFDFLGWKAYELLTVVDENGFEDSVKNELYEGKLFTTEEMMSQELFDSDIYFYTVWDLVCSGCEEQKVCEIYYIDDGRYFVCDDCYEEFATGMGLE